MSVELSAKFSSAQLRVVIVIISHSSIDLLRRKAIRVYLTIYLCWTIDDTTVGSSAGVSSIVIREPLVLENDSKSLGCKGVTFAGTVSRCGHG